MESEVFCRSGRIQFITAQYRSTVAINPTKKLLFLSNGGYFMVDSMPNWLYKRAFLTPQRTALETNGESLTFLQLHTYSEKTARQLASLHVKAGDTIAFLLENGIHTVTMIHALEYIGAVIVPLNHRLTASELTYQIHDSEAKLLIYDECFSNKVTDLKRDIDINVVSTAQLSNEKQVQVDLQTEVNLQQHHTIMYTSGTTGSPKGVILTYGNHWWSAIGSSLNLGLHETDKWLCSVPMFHMSGLSIIMRNVIYGMPIFIQKQFAPKQVNEAIINNGVTIVSVVTAMLTKMLEELEGEYPASFRCMLLGGGPAPVPLLEKCQKRNIPVFQTYGMTETAAQIVTLSSDYMLTKIGSAGKPLMHAQLKIEKSGVTLPANEIGEIVVKGASVTSGYLNRKKDTAETIQDGWLYTGDLGYVDEDGFLFVVDRRSDLIISGGENVYPAEIEEVLLSHPAITEAGVTGITDEQWGQVPIAFCVCKEKVTKHDILNHCQARLARFKLPKHIHFVDALPRNAANKLLRRELVHLLDNKLGT